MNLKNKVIDTIEKHGLIKRGDRIVAGLSGGPDSLCLFDILLSIREQYELTLTAVHINHGLRPGAADEDQAFVEEFARLHGCECMVFKADCAALAKESGRSSEEAGRELRYAAFDKVAAMLSDEDKATPKSAGFPEASRQVVQGTEFQEPGCSHEPGSSQKPGCGRIKIAVAHNANDQAETLMFRILRGTGTDGLAGMEYSRNSEAGFEIIRPLLDCTRGEIEEYIVQRGLKPCIDLTNGQPLYTRNRIRLNVLPELAAEFNPNLIETLGRLAASAQEDKDYLWLQAKAAFERAKAAGGETDAAGLESAEPAASTEISMSIDVLKALHPAILHRVISTAFGEIGLAEDITRTHLLAAEDLVRKARTGSYAEFPHGYVLTVAYDRVLARYAGMKGENCPADGSFRGRTAGSNRTAGSKCGSATKQSGCGGTCEPVHNYEMNIKTDEAGVVNVSVSGPLREIELNLRGFGGAPACGIEASAPGFGGARSDLHPQIVMRTRRDGDYIVFPSGGKNITKKLQDFFTDAKVPAHLRDRVPLIACGREILLILGDDVTGLGSGLRHSRYTANYR